MSLITCEECGGRVSSQAGACPSCGHPVRGTGVVAYAVQPQAPAGSGLGLAALLCGIGGVVMMFLPFIWLIAGLPNVLAIVLGGVTVSKTPRGQSVSGMAITGIVTGIIGLILYAGMWVLWQEAVYEAFSE